MSNPVNYSKIFLEAGKAIGIAAVVNGALYYALVAAGMIDPLFPVSPDGQTVNVVGVLFSTILSMVVGTLIFVLLARFTSSPAKIFTWVCVVVFLLTATNPFFLIPNVTTNMAIGLDILHIAPAYLLWRFLTRAV